MTAAGSSTALPGTEPGTLKVTPFTEYPAKGRATGGVRCHRFLKGEDTLVLAWAGAAPARAAGASGTPIDLPEATGRRDGSGSLGSQPIAACAGPVATAAAAAHRCARLTQCRPHRCPAPGGWLPLALAPLLLLAMAGCSDDDEPSADAKAPEEVMAAAQQTLTETSGRAADPDHRRPARRHQRRPEGRPASLPMPPPSKAILTVTLSGQPFDVPVIAVDDKV